MARRRIIDDIIGWDVKNWSKFLTFNENYLDGVSPGKTALEIGARRGGLSLYLALKGFSVVCSDYYFPEQSARELHRRYGVADKIRYAAIDVLHIPHPEDSIDLVIFKSVLGALQERSKQQQAIREMHRVLKPGGVLLFAENAVGTWLQHSLRKTCTPRLSDWRYVSLEEIRDFCRIFRAVTLESWGFFGLLGWNERMRKELGELDAVIMKLIPDSWRYILLVGAEK